DSGDSINEEVTWECGTDNFTKFISKWSIETNCPHLTRHINNCCLSHDLCYFEQKGRKFCDDNFCTCLRVSYLALNFFSMPAKKFFHAITRSIFQKMPFLQFLLNYCAVLCLI
ncbi:unnamed protein product, partial [Thelazia callipaeda]|uniref:Phospholipase A(2) n=1 Tax=Thelazia callipaeda TaxID=103827 RepID=A0A158RBP9_THECL